MITYLVISDLHLGHKRNTADEMIKALDYFFIENKNILKKLDFLFIAGDVYHGLLEHGSYESVAIIKLLWNVTMFCKNNKIKLRILEGTPSHDWNQIKLFETNLLKSEVDIDFKYIDTLYLEKTKELNILYIPDELNEDSTITLEEVKNKLKENNLQQVDIIIMHGAFDYQLPIKLKSNFILRDWLPLVKYYIHAGHIHTGSVNKKVVNQGSFDRLSQGEEEDKGGIYITIREDESNYIRLINKKAKIFKTFKMDNVTNDSLKELEDTIKDLKDDSYIRVLVKDKDASKAISEVLKNKYKNLNVSIEIKNSETEENSKLIIDLSADIIEINANNIEELLIEELKLEDKDNVEVIKILNEFK